MDCSTRTSHLEVHCDGLSEYIYTKKRYSIVALLSPAWLLSFHPLKTSKEIPKADTCLLTLKSPTNLVISE